MFVNATGLGQVNPTRMRPGTRVLRIPINMRRRGMGQAAGQAMVPGTNCTLADSPLGCSPSGIPWQASGGGPANNWVYYDSVTGQPLDLSNACYVNGNLLVNCGDTQDFGGGPPKPAGPISILAQTPAYAAAVAAANAAYVPPAAPGPTQRIESEFLGCDHGRNVVRIGCGDGDAAEHIETGTIVSGWGFLAVDRNRPGKFSGLRHSNAKRQLHGDHSLRIDQRKRRVHADGSDWGKSSRYVV
jgi:hypothetical protein